jgi:hypothetical protein
MSRLDVGASATPPAARARGGATPCWSGFGETHSWKARNGVTTTTLMKMARIANGHFGASRIGRGIPMTNFALYTAWPKRASQLCASGSITRNHRHARRSAQGMVSSTRPGELLPSRADTLASVNDLPPSPRRWRSPEELLGIGLTRSRVAMINEAHNGLARSVRTRRVGIRLLPVAHQAGVRAIAMEALVPEFAEEANETREVPAAAGGYLAQAEMRKLIATALDLGWRLLAYEADFTQKPPAFDALSVLETNWREEQQASNLHAALRILPEDTRLLVWCGNHHLAKHTTSEWTPMGARFAAQGTIDPFAIDQIATVKFADAKPYASQWVEQYASQIESLGGAAGFLSEEAPEGWPSPRLADAFVLALDNELE